MNSNAFLRILSVALCLVLCAAIFCGCGDSLEDFTKDQIESAETAAPTAAPVETDHRFDSAYQTFSPETVMVTVGTRDILWSDFFHWVYSAIVSYEAANGTVTDWADAADAIQSQALSSALQYAYVENGAASMGVKITETIENAARAQMVSEASDYGTYEAFLETIEGEYATEEYYLYTKEISAIYSALYYTVYGEEGEYLSQQAIDEAVAEDGYRMMQMILVSKYDTDTGEKLTGDALEKQEKLANWIPTQFTGTTEPEDLEELFEDYQKKYSDDSSYEQFEEGYLYQPGDFPDAVSTALDGMNEYEYTVVETDEAWYVIMKIPVNREAIPVQMVQALGIGKEYTLEYLVSVELYKETVSGWTSEFPATFSDEYNSLDLAALLNSSTAAN